LWYTERELNKVGYFNPTTHAITELTLPTAYSGPSSITAGPDSNVWVLEANGVGQIAEIDPRTLAVREFSLPVTGNYPNPFEITVGPDDNLWFTEMTGNQVGQV